MNGARQKKLLYLLGALLVVAAWVYLPQLFSGGKGDDLKGPAAQRAPADEEGGNAPGARPAARTGEVRHARPGDHVSQIRIAELDRVPTYGTSGRDPWRFYDPPPPPPPPVPVHVKTAAELEQERLARERAEALAKAQAAERAIPRPPEFTLQYIGHFGPPAKKVAVFSDGKNEFIAIEGETINKNFIVSRIGLESVEIRFVGFPNAPAKRVGIGRR